MFIRHWTYCKIAERLKRSRPYSLEIDLKYSYLRVFAVETEVPPILVSTGDAPGRRQRGEYLEDVFSAKIEFEHRSKSFVYIPISVDELSCGAVCSTF